MWLLKWGMVYTRWIGICVCRLWRYFNTFEEDNFWDYHAKMCSFVALKICSDNNRFSSRALRSDELKCIWVCAPTSTDVCERILNKVWRIKSGCWLGEVSSGSLEGQWDNVQGQSINFIVSKQQMVFIYHSVYWDNVVCHYNFTNSVNEDSS